MRIESKLCHVSDNKVIVHVTGWAHEQNLGTALAEGITVEDAEDKAISRLEKRVNTISNNETTVNTINNDKTRNPLIVQLPKSEKKQKITVNQDPSDWSNELTAIDSEIDRLKWTREDEIKFLEKALGINNRNKITKYNDIVNYLTILKKIDRPHQSELIEEKINTLIKESDNILRELSWDNIQGREYLQEEFNVSTRKELNQDQLISFVAKLKSILNQKLTP
tara:strand:- start:2449 stop:3117 length:669 start_codon:yes stop_codon:yes gene_type:complete